MHGAREEKVVSVVHAARREMARGGQAGGRVAVGNERLAGVPTRDAERGVKARGAELVDGATDEGEVAPTSPAPSDAEARENLRRIGEVTRSRFRHAPLGVGGQAGQRRSARHVHGVKDGRGGGGLSALRAERAARARASVGHDELGTSS